MSDFVISAPLLFLSILAFTLSGGLFFAQGALDYEAYHIARAHLYSKDLDYCRPSKTLWPPQILEKIKYECSASVSPGEFKPFTKNTTQVRGTLQLTTKFSLTSTARLGL